jgi:DNA-binding transcriptional ArsR family regulator
MNPDTAAKVVIHTLAIEPDGPATEEAMGSLDFLPAESRRDALALADARNGGPPSLQDIERIGVQPALLDIDIEAHGKNALEANIAARKILELQAGKTAEEDALRIARRVLSDKDRPVRKRLEEVGALVENLGPEKAEPEPVVIPRPVSEFLDMGINEIPYAVQRILPEHETAGWYGDGGAMKSLTVLDLARCISRGDPFLDKFAIHRPGPFMLLDRENGDRRTAKRVADLGFKPDDDLHILTRGDLAGLFIDDPGFPDAVLRILDNMNPRPVAGALDSWTRFFRGEENAAKDVALAFENLDRVCREGGISLFLIHHTRKHQQGDRGESRAKVRGSVDFINAVSTAFFLERLGESLRFEQVKARDHVYLDPIGIRYGQDPAAGGYLRFHADDAPPRPPTKVGAARTEILRMLRGNGPMTQADLAELVGNRNATRRAVKELEEEGLVRVNRDGGQRPSASPMVYLVDTEDVE